MLSIDQEAEEILTNTPPGESHSDNIFDTADNVFDNVDTTGVDGVTSSVEASLNDDVDLSNQSFATSQLMYNSLPLPIYGFSATDNYVKMELEKSVTCSK